MFEFAVAKQKKPPSHRIAVLVGSPCLPGQDLLKALRLVFGHELDLELIST